MSYSAICQLNDILLLGDTLGNIHCVKHSAISTEANQNLSKFVLTADELGLSQYCQASVHRAHCSFTNLMELSHDSSLLVTVGMEDQAILIWKIGKADPSRLEIDHIEHDIQQPDVFFSEIDPRDKMTNTLLSIAGARTALIEMSDKLDRTYQPEIFLRPHKVLGRKAFSTRNSIVISSNNQLIFYVGTMLVFMSVPLPNVLLGKDYLDLYFKQTLLPADEGNSMSTSPGIFSIGMCSARRYLCAGTIESNARIIKWDALSSTKLNTIVLYGYTCIEFMKFAFDSNTLVCLALHERYFTSLLVLDTSKSLILAKSDLEYSLPFKIKYVDFLPCSTVDLVTCGVRHLSVWKLRGGLLKIQGLSLSGGSARTADTLTSPDEDSDTSITFLSLVIVDNFMLVSSDNGSVITYHTGLSIQRVQTEADYRGDSESTSSLPQLLPHLQLPRLRLQMLVLITVVLVATGSLNGVVGHWEVSHDLKTDMLKMICLKEYPLASRSPNSSDYLRNPKYQIQSLIYRILL